MQHGFKGKSQAQCEHAYKEVSSYPVLKSMTQWSNLTPTWIGTPGMDGVAIFLSNSDIQLTCHTQATASVWDYCYELWKTRTFWTKVWECKLFQGSQNYIGLSKLIKKCRSYAWLPHAGRELKIICNCSGWTVSGWRHERCSLKGSHYRGHDREIMLLDSWDIPSDPAEVYSTFVTSKRTRYLLL